MLIKPKFASLTAGLLARKGEAHPAATTEFTDELTRGTYSHGYASEDDGGEPPRHQAPPAPLEQQARIVRAYDVPELAHREPRRREPIFSEPVFSEPIVAPAPAASLLTTTAFSEPVLREPVLRDQAPLSERSARGLETPAAGTRTTETESEKSCPTCPPDPQDDRRFHVSVRLRRGRYLRLKLAAASLHKPSQDIIGEALDAYFAKLGPEMLGDCPCLYR